MRVCTILRVDGMSDKDIEDWVEEQLNPTGHQVVTFLGLTYMPGRLILTTEVEV